MTNINKNSVSAWLASSTLNKIGTALWTLAGIFYLVIGFKWLSLVNYAGLNNFKIGFLLFLVYFLFYIGMTIGILLSNNLCATIARTWGVLAIVTAAIYLIMFIVALIASKVGPINFMRMLNSVKSAKGFGSFTILFLLAFCFTIATAFTVTVTDAPKSRLAALIFCLLTGVFGGHLIYANRAKQAILRIVFYITIFLAFVSGILAIIDLIKIIRGKFTDGNGVVLTEWM